MVTRSSSSLYLMMPLTRRSLDLFRRGKATHERALADNTWGLLRTTHSWSSGLPHAHAKWRSRVSYELSVWLVGRPSNQAVSYFISSLMAVCCQRMELRHL